MTITWAFTHQVAHRDGDTTTTECGMASTTPGWLDQGMTCPDCYGTTYPSSAPTTTPLNYGRRTP